VTDIGMVEDTPILLRHDQAGIATLTLNRPAKFNALSSRLLGELKQSLEAIANDPAIRVVILAANGKAFCAGHDLGEMREDTEYEPIAALFEQCSQVMLKLTEIPQPVIARVHGMATAAGCQLVATCDLAIATEEVRFATSGVNLGLFCATPMVAVTRNLSRKHAMEMLMTGDFIDAETACQWGLVNHVVPPDQLDGAVMELAKKIASKLPAAVAEGKRLFYRQLEAAMSVAYEEASHTITRNMMDSDAQEGIDAFLQKRPRPDWTPE
jgi:enoyl-CoA hydratase/carnithine racemase